MTAEARDGIHVTVGCPNCYQPTQGASPMRLIEHMDASHIAHRWRRSVLECVTCGHAVLVEVTLTNLDHPEAA